MAVSKWITIGIPVIVGVIIIMVLVLVLKPKKYDCDNLGHCVINVNGTYQTSNCDNQCPASFTSYGCNAAGDCISTPGGDYSTSDCNSACVKPAYGCDSTGKCSPMPNGSYNVSNCNSQCVVPPFKPNNKNMQVAVMDYNQQQSDLQTLIPFVKKYLPNKILWKTTGPYCATATATMSEHIAAMVQICTYYKTQGLPYPNIALFPDCSSTECYNANGLQNQEAMIFYPIVAKNTIDWVAAVTSGNNVPQDMVPYLCNELVLEQEGVTNGGEPDAFAACRAALPSSIALSKTAAFTEITSASGALIKNSIIGDNSFRPGFVYLEMYNMYTEKVPYLYDVTPGCGTIETICNSNTCVPPVNQSIYGGASAMTPELAAAQILNIMKTFGKFVGFPNNCTTPCSLRNFVFMFSYEEATSGSGPLYLLGNTINPWNYSKFSQFSNTFVTGVVSALQSDLPTVQASDIQIGVYNLENALKQWGV